MHLTAKEAQKILKAAQDKAEEMGVKVAISVVDARGDLIAMLRLDGAPWRTALISKGKAFASASFGVASAELAARASTPPMQALILAVGGECVPAQGAVPVLREGEVAGAIGVSGAAPQQDEDVARAGASVL